MKLNISNLYFSKANALDIGGLKKALKNISPLAIYCEGLLSYFTEKEENLLARIIKKLLITHGGVWITPDPALSAERKKSLSVFLPRFKSNIKKIEDRTKQKYDDHGFKSELQADEIFQKNGFLIKKIHQPTNLASLKNIKPDLAQEIIKNIGEYGKIWEMFL
jgi:hypothetical protein